MSPTGDGSFTSQNEWVAQAVSADASCRGIFFIRPEDDPEWVRQEVRRLGLHGLKCYHTMASVKPTWEAEIPAFLPEPLVRVAHEEGWVITLHMVRSRAAADPTNIHWIRHYCERYPDMKLILAHSARGFQPAHNLEGLPHLRGLDNLYFDTSANCEPIAHQAIIRIIGHDKLMYGTDLPVSHGHGRHAGAAGRLPLALRGTRRCGTRSTSASGRCWSGWSTCARSSGRAGRSGSATAPWRTSSGTTPRACSAWTEEGV